MTIDKEEELESAPEEEPEEEKDLPETEKEEELKVEDLPSL